VSVDAAGVDPPEDLDTVPGTVGDLGCRDAGVEGQGDAAVAQVVRAPGERGCLLGLGERGGARFLPDPAVDACAEDAAVAARVPGDLEQPPVVGGAEAFQVIAQDGDEDGRDGDDARTALRARCLSWRRSVAVPWSADVVGRLSAMPGLRA